MTEAAVLPPVEPETLAPERAIYFTRLGPDSFELELRAPAILTRAEARALAQHIEAETGSAWARTLGRLA